MCPVCLKKNIRLGKIKTKEELFNKEGYLTKDALTILKGYLTPEAVYTHMNSKNGQCPMKKSPGKYGSAICLDTKEEKERDEELKKEFYCEKCNKYLCNKDSHLSCKKKKKE